MRVVALYDIHGNLPALEAVLDEALDVDPDAVVVGGDVVPGPMPIQALETLMGLDLPVRFIHGNGETDVLTAAAGREPTRVPAAFRDIVRWVADELDPQHVEVLEAWPLTCELDIEGLGTVHFCHATPRDDNELFTRLTPEDRLAPVFEPTGADVVVCGHTHMPFVRRVGGLRVVNAGSVGMPFGAAEASWLLLAPGTVELRSTAYDLDDAMARIGATGYPRVETIDLRNPPAEEQMLDLFEAAALS